MKKKVNVRQWFAFFLFLAAVCAGLLQYNLNTFSNGDNAKLIAKDGTGGQYGDAQYVNTQPVEESAFSQARIDRDEARSKFKDDLASVANSKTDIEASSNAQKELLQLSGVQNTEAKIESILKQKGFKDVLAYIGNDKSVDVLIMATKLSSQEATLIADTSARQAGVTMDKVYVRVSAK